MADRIPPAHRSWNMSRIRSRDTRPELLLRSLLHKKGIRFRLHVADLPGKPDIVLPKFKTVIFVNGCFWHRHKGCRFATTPSTRKEFWLSKFEETVRRDSRKSEALIANGWKVLTVWECEIENDPDMIVNHILNNLRNSNG